MLVDVESYQQMRDSIGILKIFSQSERDIEKQELYPQKKVFSEIENKLKNRQMICSQNL